MVLYFKLVSVHVYVVCVLLSFVNFHTESYKIRNSEDVLSYLQHFGYLAEENVIDSSSEDGVPTVSIDDVEKALMHFQEMSHIAPKGKITSKTIHTMNTPRCGNRDERLWEGDEIEYGQNTDFQLDSYRVRRRGKRQVGRKNKWKKKMLTYLIAQFPTGSPSKLNIRAVQSEFDYAFKYWEDVSGLRFKKAKEGQKADITIRFLRGSHGDFESFDGPGRTLAHGFYPVKGVVHMDDEERWSIGYKKRHFDIRTVAVHEIGHALGLVHTNVTAAIMYYQYRGHRHPNHDDFNLHPNDIESIQAIYGAKTRKEKNKDAGNPHEKPDLCRDPKINAVTTMADGHTYIFKGDYYFRVEGMPWKIHNTHAHLISATFVGVPSDLDAVLTMKNSRTYFFKGNHYWRSWGTNMDPGYPKIISSNFNGVPSNMDAAMIWSWNGEPYFFKGQKYWKYNESHALMRQYPNPISKYWPGIPNSIDAAFQAPDNRTYFFKGHKYWMFHDPNSQVEATSYPQLTTDFWLKCPTNDILKKRKNRNRRRHFRIDIDA